MDRYPIICQGAGTGETWALKSRNDRTEIGGLRRKVFYPRKKKTFTVVHDNLPSFAAAGAPSKALLEAFFNTHADQVFTLRMDYDTPTNGADVLHTVAYAAEPPNWEFDTQVQLWKCTARFEEI